MNLKQTFRNSSTNEQPELKENERTNWLCVRFFKKSNQAFAVQVILQTFGNPSFIRKLATVYVSNNFCLENIQAQTVPLLENYFAVYLETQENWTSLRE